MQKRQKNLMSPVLFHISRGQRLDNTSSFTEPRPENPVRVLEHAIFQGDNNKLRTLEARLDQSTDILSVGKIKGSIHFVQDIHWRRLELKERHDERDGDE